MDYLLSRIVWDTQRSDSREVRSRETLKKHGVYGEYKNRTRINFIGTSPSETTRLSVEGTTYKQLKPPTTIYNHLEKFSNHLQLPQKHSQTIECF